MSVQTNIGIKSMIDDGEIVMVPLDRARINNGSVDVSLGRFVARINRQYWSKEMGGSPDTINVNRMSGNDVFHLEDLQRPFSHQNTGVLRLRRGERVLAHTHEFIGSRARSLPEMRAKSTMARWGLTVCACAGWGDVGYYSRWCMEISNLNPGPVEIAMGTLVAQIVFHAVAAPEAGTVYNQPGAGTYQQTDDIERLVRDWRPESILPKAMKAIELVPLNAADREGI